MTVDSDDAVRVVVDFCALQRKLVQRFRETVRPTDFERFSGIPRTGHINFEQQTWTYRCHGAGVLFQGPHAVVDAHIGLKDFPSAIDAWRLLLFLESVGISSLLFEQRSIPADDERALNSLLEQLVAAGVLRNVPLQPPTRIYQPADE